MKRQEVRLFMALMLSISLIFVPAALAAEKSGEAPGVPPAALTPVQEEAKLTVTIDGPEGAKWLFQGKSFDSGHALEGIAAGKYAVLFSDVKGWDKPGDAELSLSKGHVVSLHGAYVRHLGALAVKVEGPGEAKWIFSDKSYESGQRIENLPTGEYKVSFPEIPDWTKPGDKTVAVEKDITASLDEKYIRHTGSADVKIEGPEEVKWTFDGEAYSGNYILTGVPTGKYALAFPEVPGWTAPQSPTVEIAKDKTVAIVGKYVRHTGAVTAKIDGPGEATWIFEGKDYKSGHKVDGVPTGKYAVAFSEVPEWTRPADVSIEITKGGTASPEGKYIRHSGSLTANIDGPKEARWIFGGKEYESGQKAEGIPTGRHTVSFSDVPGWTKPENAPVTIKNKETAGISEKYVRHTGAVKVDIAGTGEGRWSLDGKGNFPSGWTEKNVVVGPYKILFSDVSGRIKPEPLPVTVVHNTTTSIKAEYVKNTGSVTVKIDGPEEARWTVDGRGSYASGQTVGEILPGGHTISFTYVKGWKSPSDVKITIQKDATASAEGKYTEIQ